MGKGALGWSKYELSPATTEMREHLVCGRGGGQPTITEINYGSMFQSYGFNKASIQLVTFIRQPRQIETCFN